MSTPAERPHFLRLVRWAAASLLCILGATLSITSLSSYWVVHGAQQTVAWGQGESFVQALDRATQRGLHTEEAVLRSVLESETPHGLRCIVLFDRERASEESAVTAVGSCLTPHSQWRGLAMQPGPSVLSVVGDRMRIIMGAPPPSPSVAEERAPGLQTPPHGMPPPPGAPWPTGTQSQTDSAASSGPPWPGPPPYAFWSAPQVRPPASMGPHRPHPMLIEFAPQMAQELRSSATRTLFSGGVATLALLLGAVVLWQLTRREERSYASKERQRQLASLGEMAAVLAHELRNPLAALKGHAQLLLEQLQVGSRQHDKAIRVVKETERLESLSEDLLSFVRTTVIERQAVSPAQLLTECAETLADPRIELDTQGAPATWLLDPARMQQVLNNLLRNALEASTAAGRVLAGVHTEKGQLVLVVRDFGKGIPSQDIEKIFEPFYTTRARGTGLGLPISRRLVSLHGGTLTASNAAEGGALFCIRLPAMPRSQKE